MEVITIKIEDGRVLVDPEDYPLSMHEFKGISDDDIYYTLIGHITSFLTKFKEEIDKNPDIWKES